MSQLLQAMVAHVEATPEYISTQVFPALTGGAENEHAGHESAPVVLLNTMKIEPASGDEGTV